MGAFVQRIKRFFGYGDPVFPDGIEAFFYWEARKARRTTVHIELISVVLAVICGAVYPHHSGALWPILIWTLLAAPLIVGIISFTYREHRLSWIHDKGVYVHLELIPSRKKKRRRNYREQIERKLKDYYTFLAGRLVYLATLAFVVGFLPSRMEFATMVSSQPSNLSVLLTIPIRIFGLLLYAHLLYLPMLLISAIVNSIPEALIRSFASTQTVEGDELSTVRRADAETSWASRSSVSKSRTIETTLNVVELFYRMVMILACGSLLFLSGPLLDSVESDWQSGAFIFFIVILAAAIYASICHSLLMLRSFKIRRGGVQAYWLRYRFLLCRVWVGTFALLAFYSFIYFFEEAYWGTDSTGSSLIWLLLIIAMSVIIPWKLNKWGFFSTKKLILQITEIENTRKAAGHWAFKRDLR